MTSLLDPEHVILETKGIVESNRRSEIRIKANGGNSILIVCEPNRELEYIQAISKIMTDELYQIIDLNSLLNEFVESNMEELNQSFEILQSSVNQIFKRPKDEEGADFFSLILQRISNSLNDKKIPVLIHTGVLYGSDIENVHIMESELVMGANLPLIILYPATKENENLMFLGKRPASKYRGMIID